MSTSWLVTGARGQLGSDLLGIVGARPDDRVRGVGRQELDLTDEQAVRALVRDWLTEADRDGRRAVLVNAAAYTAVDAAEDDEATAFAPDDVVALLREHIGERVTGPLFASPSGRRLSRRQVHRRLAIWAERAGIARGCHPHRFRHTFGQRVYDRTHDILVVARAMNHKSIASSAVYARANTEAVRLAIA